MSRNKLIIFFILLLILSGYYLYLNNNGTKSTSEPYAISVICSGKSTENLSVMKSGIEKAADEMNADISFYTLTSDNDANQQIELLKREINNGANAVLIMPVDSPNLIKPMKEGDKIVPVIVLQSSLSNLSDLVNISCNNDQLGQNLAKEILQKQNSSQRFVILNRKNSPEFCGGVEKVLKDAGAKPSYLDFSDLSQDAPGHAERILLQHKGEVFIAADSATLELFGKAEKVLKSKAAANTQIFGVGRSSSIVSLLEEGVIQAIGVENQYGIGYLGIKMAVDRINHIPCKNMNINFVISDSSNMYHPENEYMLFPFVS
ncbi:substrate-binding domain-containing protein [Caproicibacter sp.]|uniref:substrate-binding domain-containing protein n=1 Tax=Caproicibacter sp. TaxID=2814884 RepID=UPI003989E2FB